MILLNEKLLPSSVKLQQGCKKSRDCGTQGFRRVMLGLPQHLGIIQLLYNPIGMVWGTQQIKKDSNRNKIIPIAHYSI